MTRTTAHIALAAVLAAALAGCTTAQPATRPPAVPDDPTTASSPLTEQPTPPAQGCRGELPTDVPPLTVDVRLEDGVVQPSPDRIEVPAGTTVVLRAQTDTPTEIHVHGYDLTAQAEPDRPACLEVLTDAPGVFDVEAHPETLLLQLAVR
ncbi:hypothetical protein [Promicromonospora sp. NPDC019610]|uniref:hypothetical protein n=1 Tax=Promicromonospora sp. NPDC019610 TaxID=3364405 RepID=UPI00379DE139